VLDYEIELTTFPLAPHDDRVDSTSQFLNWVRGWGERIDSAGAGLLRTMADEMSGEQETSDAGYGSIGSGTDITGY
jgi:hypothetical protein